MEHRRIDSILLQEQMSVGSGVDRQPQLLDLACTVEEGRLALDGAGRQQHALFRQVEPDRYQCLEVGFLDSVTQTGDLAGGRHLHSQ